VIGAKHDAGKPRPALIPGMCLLAVGTVLEYGARKYCVDGWKHVPDARARYADALHRHFCAWLDGDRFDEESNLMHIAHVATNALFLLWFDLQEVP
jgi:hypothetical protein